MPILATLSYPIEVAMFGPSIKVFDKVIRIIFNLRLLTSIIIKLLSVLTYGAMKYSTPEENLPNNFQDNSKFCSDQ